MGVNRKLNLGITPPALHFRRSRPLHSLRAELRTLIQEAEKPQGNLVAEAGSYVGPRDKREVRLMFQNTNNAETLVFQNINPVSCFPSGKQAENASERHGPKAIRKEDAPLAGCPVGRMIDVQMTAPHWLPTPVAGCDVSYHIVS